MEHEDKEQPPPGETTSTWAPKQVAGSHLFTIRNYSLLKGLCVGAGNCVSSDEFQVGDSAWKINMYPYAKNDSFSSAGYISIFLALASPKPAIVSFSLLILDQSGGNKHKVNENRLPFEFSRSGTERGWFGFIKRGEMESSGFLKDDCLLIHCTMTVVHPPSPDSSVTVPLPEITHDLRRLLRTGKGADMSFDVDGEQFPAHKSVLAARSSVLRAQFFDSAKDESPNQIKLHGIETAVLKALLDFIYCDLLPNLEDFSIAMTRNLLSLAYRYDLNRLKVFCTSHVRESISIDTVASTWALAERCRSSELKLCCLKFVASLQRPEDLVRTSDFERVKETDPLIAEFLQSLVGWKDLPAEKEEEDPPTEASDAEAPKQEEVHDATEASYAELPKKEEDPPKMEAPETGAEFPNKEGDPPKMDLPKKEEDASMESPDVDITIQGG